MRRRGFTLVEVLAALAVSVLSLALTVQFGRTWWQRQQEERFFQAFAQEWEALMKQARTATVSVQVVWVPALRHFRFERMGQERLGLRVLTVPDGVTVSTNGSGPSQWLAGKSFTDLRTYTFTRLDQTRVQFSTQLGWGVLVRK